MKSLSVRLVMFALTVMFCLLSFAGPVNAATSEEACAALQAASDSNGECWMARDAVDQYVADCQYLREYLIDTLAPMVNDTGLRNAYIADANDTVDEGLEQYYSTTSGYFVWVDVQEEGISLIGVAQSWLLEQEWDHVVTIAGESCLLTGSAETHFASMTSEAEATLTALQALEEAMWITIFGQGE